MFNAVEAKETISSLPMISNIKGIQVCGLSGKQHVEMELFSPDPQIARVEVEKTLSEKFPKTKFRLLFYRSKA